MLEVGKPAPSFNLPDQNGNPVSLESLKGRRVVLYFYPKDDTPGCTIEACEFTKGLKQFEGLNATVYGCSADDAESHKKFIAKYDLAIGLLTDADNAVMTAYGAYGEKNLYGKTVQGVIRSTVLIDEQGVVAAHWPKVSAEGHAAEVAAMLARHAGDAKGSVVVVAADAPKKARKPSAKKAAPAPAAAAPVAEKTTTKAKKPRAKAKAKIAAKPVVAKTASSAKSGKKSKPAPKAKSPAGKAKRNSAKVPKARPGKSASRTLKARGKPAKPAKAVKAVKTVKAAKPAVKSSAKAMKPAAKATARKAGKAKSKAPAAKRPARAGKR